MKYKVPFNPKTGEMLYSLVYRMPFYSNVETGNLIDTSTYFDSHYGDPQWERVVFDVDFKEPFMFDGQMIVQNYERGNSAAYFVLYNLLDNKQYTMFMTDMIDFLHHTELLNGEMTKPAKFIHQKRGKNFGVRLIL